MIIVVAEYFSPTEKIKDTNPWLPEQHILDVNGRLHDLPCHAGEDAVAHICFAGEECEQSKIKDGCYIHIWGEIEENCWLTNQNVKMCKNLKSIK